MSRPDRTTEPTPSALRPFDFPEIVERRLSNTVPVEVVRLPRLPVATAYLVLPAGEEGLKEAAAGLSVLTGDALEGGTVHRTGADLAEALEDLGADVDVHTGWSVTTVSISCLADRLEDGIRLLAEMVREPAFPEAEVERARQQQLARIRQRGMDPGSIASRRLNAEIYAADEAYGRDSLGEAATVSGFTRDTVRGYADAAYQSSGAALVVAGDVDPDEVRGFAEKALGDWPGRPAALAPAGGTPRPGVVPRVVIVDLPAAVQSEIRIGHVGISRAHPDFAALQVGNAILGGTFSSRLNLNLRETHGFTYGVRSRFVPRRGRGPFQISTAVDTVNTPAAIREALHEVDRILADGPTAEEVEATRDYLAGIFPLRLESTGQVAARVAERRIHGLPDDEWTGYRERIRAVTREAAHEALRAAIRPGEFAVVVSGDATALRPGLEALEVGPLTVESRD